MSTHNQADSEHPGRLAPGCFSAPRHPPAPSSRWLQLLELTIGSLNLLGLDAVLVGLCWQDAAARQWNVTLLTYEQFLLAAAIWLAYIADRAVDVRRYRKVNSTALPLRHAFLWKHHIPFAIAFGLLAIGALFTAVMFCSRAEWYAGLTFAGIAASYMLFAQSFPGFWRRIIPREVTVAVLFLAGSVLFPFTSRVLPFQTSEIIWFLWGSILLWANAYGISVWEQQQDERLSEPTSASRMRFAESRYRWFLRIIILVALLRCFLNPATSSITLAVALGAILLSIVDQLKKTWIKPALADLSVLTPWIFR